MQALRTLLASLVLAVAGGAVLAAATDRFQAYTSAAARRIEIRQHPRPVPAVTLETQTGTRIGLDDFRGSWLLVNFIYTRCMSYCTVQGGEFSQLQASLAGPLARGKLRLLSISFDSGHDTPARLADYLQRFRNHGAGWLAARPAGPEDLNRLKRAFGLVVVPDGLGGFVHNTGIELVDPQGRLVAVYDTGNPADVENAVLEAMQ